MAEVYAIDKMLDLVKIHAWNQVNVCTDSLSFLQSLENSQFSLFPSTLGKLNQIVADLLYNINCDKHIIKYTWCPVHVEIKHNEKVDLLAKEAAIGGEILNNFISSRELIFSFKLDYARYR